jgi:hypothetical protein
VYPCNTAAPLWSTAEAKEDGHGGVNYMSPRLDFCGLHERIEDFKVEQCLPCVGNDGNVGATEQQRR